MPRNTVQVAPDPLGVLLSRIEGMDVETAETRSPEALARLFIRVRKLYDDLDEVNKKIHALKDKMAMEILPAALEEAGITTITLKEGFRVSVSAMVRASTRDMAQGIAWMKENGHGAIVKETINAQTLAAMAKSLAQENKELPDEIFNVWIGQNTSITKVT